MPVRRQPLLMIDLIGRPFSEIKCWDLVRIIYDRLGKPLPDYTEMLDGGTVCSTLVEEIDTLEKYAICTFDLQGTGTISHVGIYMGGNRLLHATEGSGVCVERFARYASRLKAIYRRKDD